MLKAKLIRIESNHNNIRTTETEGKCTHVPEVGYEFQLFGDSLEFKGGLRVITTTEVKECAYNEERREFVFKTRNSTYALQVLDDKDPVEYKRYVSARSAAQ